MAPGMGKGSPNAKKKQTSLNGFLKGSAKVTAADVVEEDVDKVEEDADIIEDDEDGADALKANKKLSPDESTLPPINKIPDIFADVVQRVPDIQKVAIHLKGRKLRVATMCSGTESPLLALGLVGDAMKGLYGVALEVEHVFSCEIEPFKQAYIERNFSPPILFRDVCELGGKTATTAYGAQVQVPGDVDILIAGTSCVDYSNLNNEKQDISANGESGRTFRGMLSWVDKKRPPIVILENVCSAPWDKVCGYFADIKYSAGHMRVDTKNYYIPHTRMRGYLVAYDQKNSSLPDKWKKMLTSIQRPASSTLDAFMLPSDDPRIHNAREKLVQESKAALERRREKIDWGRCENRHSRARLEEDLGNKRPLTNWSEGGNSKMLDFVWSDWGSVQVERVWDLMDITTLRKAKVGVDPSYKTQVWNLSQNVDRQIDSNRVGIAPCLTPSMIPYITNRGGPMVGLEALSLQGLPIDLLLLTRETEDQLADLAGNAMSTTVVGSAILASLIVGRKLLEPGPEQDDNDGDVFMDDAKAKPVVADSIEGRIKGDDQLVWQPLNLLPLTQQYDLRSLMTRAKDSSRLCTCEGRTGMTTRSLSLCTACDHTSCSKCGGRPEHEPTLLLKERLGPSVFSKELKDVLPMRLSFSAITDEELESIKAGSGKENLSSAEKTLWKIWKEAVIRAVGDEVRFVELKRGENWVASYKSRSASLELTLYPSPGLPEWRFTAFPLPTDPANAPSRKLLSDAVARLVCKGNSFLDGTWEFALPFTRTAKLSVKGVLPKVPSYEKRLGLLGPEFKDKDVYSQLQVLWMSEGENATSLALDHDIAGIYQLLDKCGTANSALHRKIDIAEENTESIDQRPLYLFLDPSRTGDPAEDAFVFSKDKKRLEYRESREIVAKLHPSWRQSTPVEAEDGDNEGQTTVQCHIPCIWKRHESIALAASKSAESQFGVPVGAVQTDTGVDACASAQALLSCKVHVTGNSGPEWRKANWLEVDQVHELEVFKASAYFTERVKHVNKDMDQWHTLELPDEFHHCERCAPVPPAIRWVKTHKKVIAMEDTSQAGTYEVALKNRPSPFVTHVKHDAEHAMGLMRIGVNLTSLVHRASARLPSQIRTERLSVAWTLNTDFTPQPTINLHKFSLMSNKLDPPADQPPNFKKKVPLRPEQQRSLDWMIRQEADDSPMFVEEEIAEAILPTLGWRAQGRAQRPVRIRGGVLADQVGYGKTAITLGLIDSTFGKAEEGLTNKDVPGYIPVKATLVVVPSHLTRQWKSEVQKFTGSHFTVEVIHTAAQLNALTINAVQEADIVVVASSLFHSEAYLRNLEAFAAGEDLPNQDGRYFNARLLESLASLKTQVERLKLDGAGEVLKEIRSASDRNVEKELDFVQSKRLKGKKYRDTAEQAQGKDVSSDVEESEESPDAKPAGKKRPAGKALVAQARKSSSDEPAAQVQRTPNLPKTVVEVVVEPIAVVKKRWADEKGSLSRTASSTTLEADDSDAAGEGVTRTDRPRRANKRKSIIISDDEDEPEADGSDFEAGLADTSSVTAFTSEGASSEDDDESSFSMSEEGSPPPKKAIKAKAKSQVRKPVRPAKPSQASSEDGMEVDSDELSSKPKANSKKRKSGVLGASDDEPTAKKVKKEAKPKPRRALGDPWKLGSSATKSDFTRMRAPPLEMFHFHRLVIDEFTYLKGKDQFVVNNLQSTCRWILSGTPPVQDFASVKCIAAFMGIHLGVDDDGEGSRADMKRRSREQTEVEKFHSFREVRSLEWHQHRQTVGQRFLDQFVRQNIAEIDEIPLEEEFVPVHLPASERAIYLELEHHLQALDMTIKKAKKSESDREKRLNKSLGDSHSAEEALLKRCSHFDLEATKENAVKACTSIVQERQSQLDQCQAELLKQLKVAVEQQRKIKAKAGKLQDESYFENFVRTTCTEGQGERESTSIILDLFEQAGISASGRSTIVNTQDGASSRPNTSGAKKQTGRWTKQSSDDHLSAAVKDLIWEHREHTHELRRLVKELVARKRSLRFFTAVRDLQRDQNEESSTVSSYNCPKCGKEKLSTDELGLLSGCGHMGCLSCITDCAAEREACVAESSEEACKALSRRISIVEARSLGVDDLERDGRGKHFGRKLEQIMTLIKDEIPKDERVLVFVQFDDLMKKVAEAFTANKIKYLEIRGSASTKSKALEKFQEDSAERVLLLHVTDESASGANLTGANHAIFVSPLLTATQETYDACMTQAVGRLRRFGQLKLVHIYHFLSKDTIDVDILKKRMPTEDERRLRMLDSMDTSA